MSKHRKFTPASALCYLTSHHLIFVIVSATNETPRDCFISWIAESQDDGCAVEAAG